MSDQTGGPEGPDMDDLKERLKDVVKKAKDLDVEVIKEIIDKVPANEKRKKKAWLDLESLVDDILSADRPTSEDEAEIIQELTDEILDRS